MKERIEKMANKHKELAFEAANALVEVSESLKQKVEAGTLTPQDCRDLSSITWRIESSLDSYAGILAAGGRGEEKNESGEKAETDGESGEKAETDGESGEKAEAEGDGEAEQGDVKKSKTGGETETEKREDWNDWPDDLAAE